MFEIIAYVRMYDTVLCIYTYIIRICLLQRAHSYYNILPRLPVSWLITLGVGSNSGRCSEETDLLARSSDPPYTRWAWNQKSFSPHEVEARMVFSEKTRMNES